MNLYQRLIRIMERMGAVGKGGKTDYGDNFEYHKIDEVDDKLRGALVAERVVAVLSKVVNANVRIIEGQDRYGNVRSTYHAECEVEILLINADNPEEQLSIVGWGHGLDYSDKATSKAIAYAAKSAYLNTFHLRGQPDNEGDSMGIKPPPAEVDEKVENALADYRSKITNAKSVDALNDVGLELAKEPKPIGDGVRKFYEARLALLRSE